MRCARSSRRNSVARRLQVVFLLHCVEAAGVLFSLPRAHAHKIRTRWSPAAWRALRVPDHAPQEVSPRSCGVDLQGVPKEEKVPRFRVSLLVPPCTPLMRPRARSHMPTRMGPHSETAPAGACRNMKHSRILSTRAVLRAHTSRRPRTPLEMSQAFVARIRSSQVPSTGGVN